MLYELKVASLPVKMNREIINSYDSGKTGGFLTGEDVGEGKYL